MRHSQVKKDVQPGVLGKSSLIMRGTKERLEADEARSVIFSKYRYKLNSNSGTKFIDGYSVFYRNKGYS